MEMVGAGTMNKTMEVEMEMVVALFHRIHVSTVFAWKIRQNSELSMDGS
jgi:hypothetical protein